MLTGDEWVVVRRFDWGWSNPFYKGARPWTFGAREDAERWMAERGLQGNEWRAVTVGQLARGTWEW